MSNKANLSWGDRFALMSHYSGASDEAVCQAFGVTADELVMARKLKDAGTLVESTTFDAKRYGNPFSTTEGTTVKAAPTRATKHVRASGKPETATKTVKPAQKRGRKGNKIVTALRAIPTTPVSVEEFRAQHGVSVAVLRQSKRFVEKMEATDRAELGVVKVRQDKATKVLMIWREVAAKS